MNITDKLRKFANDRFFFGNGYMELYDIANRIDAEYQKVLDERFNALMDARDKGVNAVLKGPEGFGLIALPKDADDVRWNIGDKDEDGNEVIAFKLASDGWYVITNSEWPFRPEKRHHYPASTVEDVLRNVVTLCHNTWKEESPFHFYDVDDVMESGNIAEFAAKLQLKEE